MSSLIHDLINAGVHFGQRTSAWNPKMERFLYGKRNGIHIIDIRETVKGLLLAKKYITRTVSEGRDVCFVGTKRQARDVINQRVADVGMHFVTERWLGGTLTNFRTIRARLKRLEVLEAIAQADNFASYSKKMESQLRREMTKIHRNLSGIRHMSKLPGALVVIDVRRELNALREARKLGIPTVCLIDTDGDPDLADIPIPGNDDSMRSIDVVVRELCTAVSEGKQNRQTRDEGADSAEGASEQRPRRSRRSQYRADDAPSVNPHDMDDAPVTAPLTDGEFLTILTKHPDASGESSSTPVVLFAALDGARNRTSLLRGQRATLSVGIARVNAKDTNQDWASVDAVFVPLRAESVAWEHDSPCAAVTLRPKQKINMARISFTPLEEGFITIDVEALQRYRKIGVIRVRATVSIGSEGHVGAARGMGPR